MLKRAFDFVLALLFLVILSPLFLLIVFLIKLDSPGPVFYRGRRVGKGNLDFDMLKFRTMVVNADKIGGSSTPDDDPRITRMGAFLRKTKLDEIPQLVNVFFGEMSFVGPRPQVRWAVEKYSDEERSLLTIRPGITDYASLYFPNEGEILKGSTDPDRDYFLKIHPKKMRLSLKYHRESSLLVDIKIIVATIMAVIGIKGGIDEKV